LFFVANARPVVTRDEGQGQKVSIVLVGAIAVFEQLPAPVKRLDGCSSVIFAIHGGDSIENRNYVPWFTMSRSEPMWKR
jgi:hypothetical protein